MVRRVASSLLVGLIISGLIVSTAAAQRGGPLSRSVSPDRAVRLDDCLISLIDDVQVPAQLPGVLMELPAREGARVDEGDLLAKIDDSDAVLRRAAAEAELQAARAQAENDIEVRNAIATAKVADAEYADSLDINRQSRGTIAATQLRREQLTAEREHLRIDVAKMQQEVAGYQVHVRQAELDAAQNEITRRRVTAPTGGEVVKLYRRVGEWVQAGDPIVQLVRMDRLRVEGFVRADQYLASDILGASATVTVELPGGRTESVNGQITFVSPLVEANGEYRVWAEVDNKMENNFWVLQPGKVAAMDIHLGTRRPVASR